VSHVRLTRLNQDFARSIQSLQRRRRNLNWVSLRSDDPESQIALSIEAQVQLNVFLETVPYC
jgi:hypothetical protein